MLNYQPIHNNSSLIDNTRSAISITSGYSPNYQIEKYSGSITSKLNYEEFLLNSNTLKIGKYELVLNSISNSAEQLVDFFITRKIKVKYNKPIKLEFVSIEDSNGFIENVSKTI